MSTLDDLRDEIDRVDEVIVRLLNERARIVCRIGQKKKEQNLPIEEAGGFRETLAASGIDTIFLLSPTTTDARIRRAAELGSGFLYGISRLGVTGARAQVASGAEAMVRRIRAHTAMPIALGFGISHPDHVAEVCTYADAAVVGSALVSVIAEAGATTGLLARVENYVQWLRGASALDVHA